VGLLQSRCYSLAGNCAPWTWEESESVTEDVDAPCSAAFEESTQEMGLESRTVEVRVTAWCMLFHHGLG